MHKVGGEDMLDAMEPKKGMKFRPSFYTSAEDFPAIKDWEVGSKYEIRMIVKQTSKNENGEGRVSASFEIHSIGGKNSAPERYSRRKS